MSFFIGLGGQKCGSTWLDQYLRTRTDAGLLPIKELSWFNEATGKTTYYNGHFRSQADRITTTLARRGLTPNERQQCVIERANIVSHMDYRNLFLRRFDLSRTNCGEISPNYGLLDSCGFGEIISLFPDVRFFMICRNPADRYWSGLNWWSKLHGDFEVRSEFAQRLTNSEFSRFTEYHSIVGELELAAGKDRIFLAFYEDLFSVRGSDVLKSLCRFLGISYGDPDLHNFVLSNDYPQLDPQLRRQSVFRFRMVYEWAAETMGSLPPSWRSDLSSIS